MTKLSNISTYTRNVVKTYYAITNTVYSFPKFIFENFSILYIFQTIRNHAACTMILKYFEFTLVIAKLVFTLLNPLMLGVHKKAIHT